MMPFYTIDGHKIGIICANCGRIKFVENWKDVLKEKKETIELA
jgi:hypothetical protein